MIISDIITQAENYHNQGFISIPVQYKGKNPIITDWTKRTLDEVDINSDFSKQCNIGILLGEASGNLIDIDIDSPEALIAAQTLLPDTQMIFGRESNPKSHYVYKVDISDGTKKLEFNGSNFIECRGNG